MSHRIHFEKIWKKRTHTSTTKKEALIWYTEGVKALQIIQDKNKSKSKVKELKLLESNRKGKD